MIWYHCNNYWSQTKSFGAATESVLKWDYCNQVSSSNNNNNNNNNNRRRRKKRKTAVAGSTAAKIASTVCFCLALESSYWQVGYPPLGQPCQRISSPLECPALAARKDKASHFATEACQTTFGSRCVSVAVPFQKVKVAWNWHKCLHVLQLSNHWIALEFAEVGRIISHWKANTY